MLTDKRIKGMVCIKSITSSTFLNYMRKKGDNMKKKEKDNMESEGKCMSTVKVGAKGQIVIPVEARDLLDIKPGDNLLLLADENRGIAIQKMNFFTKMADAIFGSKTAEEFTEDEKGIIQMAEVIKGEK